MKNKTKNLKRLIKVSPIIAGLLVLGLIFAIIGIWWLGLSLMLIYTAYRLVFLIRILRENLFSNLLLNFSFIVVFAIFCRVFIFEVFIIPSASMEDALFSGNIILVSKLNYGPNLPRSPSEIPWINLFYKKPAPEKDNQPIWNVKHLSGFSEIKRGDITVFKRPDKRNNYLIKRCMALAGDKLQIVDSKVFINDKIVLQPATVKKDFYFSCTNTAQLKQLSEEWGFVIKSQEQLGDTFIVRTSLNRVQHAALKNLQEIKDLKSLINNSKAYPRTKGFSFTADNMGPFIVPFKGMKVLLNDTTYNLYRAILKSAEHVSLKRRGENYYINGRAESSYTFKNNYFFMLGDNRDDSSDSRFWGYVAAHDILGKHVITIF
ncbi:signal peptidase I [Pelobium manganitolerans]|uniref:signal peptidase I n=1 Tax=Pelobium manganitolerans TaxID=1842495 RepID=UPI003FA3C157